MNEITSDDHPTYEESVNLTLAERELRKDAVTDKILLSRALHRLACIETDIEIISRHICRFDKEQIFKLPSTNPNGSVFADEAWHNVSNIEIACDLNDDAPLHWASQIKGELTKDQMMEMEQQIR